MNIAEQVVYAVHKLWSVHGSKDS